LLADARWLGHLQRRRGHEGHTIRGGVEGSCYVPPGSPLFVDFNVMLVCEYGSGGVFAYDLDANADPIPYSRRPFMTGLIGAQSAAIDPLSGDFVFSTYGGNGTIVAVRGFSLPCGAIVSYGAARAARATSSRRSRARAASRAGARCRSRSGTAAAAPRACS
jgi:hypothetical protein